MLNFPQSYLHNAYLCQRSIQNLVEHLKCSRSIFAKISILDVRLCSVTPLRIDILHIL